MRPIKVSYSVFLLVLLIEECAEVIQRACKAIRFGMMEKWKEDGPTNQEALQMELFDLQAAIEMNQRAGNLKYVRLDVRAEAERKKQEKVHKFSAYSRVVCKTIIPEGEEGEGNFPACYEVYKRNLTDTPPPQSRA